jgi:hypothetical protein
MATATQIRVNSLDPAPVAPPRPTAAERLAALTVAQLAEANTVLNALWWQAFEAGDAAERDRLDALLKRIQADLTARYEAQYGEPLFSARLEVAS